MRDIGERYLVVIRLNERSDLSITTSAAHALAILNGETVFAVKSAEVFDSDGNRVPKGDLEAHLKRSGQQK